jgi:hypothetical protein
MTVLMMACGAIRTVHVPSTPPTTEQLAELWVDPGATPRDLFWGIGGQERAPAKDAVYKMQARDDSGFSASYDVEGPDGLEWSAKIGPEAQTEVSCRAFSGASATTSRRSTTCRRGTSSSARVR